MSVLDPSPVLPTHAVVRVPADLDISTLDAFRDALEHSTASGRRAVVVDFTECRYLDAQAIRVLLEVHQQLWPLDRRLVLRACNPDTVRLLSLAGLTNVFHFEPGPVTA